MQIKIHLNGARKETSENVVQKVLKTPHASQDESAQREWMYIQVSSISYCKFIERSPCSVDKFKLLCLYLLKYLFLLLYGRYHRAKIEISPHKSLVLLRENFSINTFCDLSTNGRGSKCGIELSSILTTEKLRKTLNSFFYGILLIQRHLNYEFRDNHHEHRILLLAHNQITDVTSPSCHYLLLLLAFYSSGDNCHATLSIENGISTSNHKLKMSPTTHQRHRHRRSNSNDSVKSHLNAILFLIILCIPLLTTTATASNVHNLKYSTNVVKTKYGPLRGIVLRHNPTVEGYLGVPYGETKI
jgi:hypothetical protein